MRTPADETLRELPTDMYCKAAQNDPSTVRGARNYPCQEFPGKRAPTVQLCRDPKGYVPVGRNPWRGPPVPYGTPVTNGLNILPPNKFPYHSAGRRSGSGHPDRRAAPAGCGARARAGCRSQPAYDPPPPNNSGPPPGKSWMPPAVPPVPPQLPYPKWLPPPPPPEGIGPPPSGRPEKPWGPPPGPALQPQASGPAYTTYDQNTGAFKDPAGGTGIFAPGANGASSAENWVDLMLDPRPM